MAPINSFPSVPSPPPGPETAGLPAGLPATASTCAAPLGCPQLPRVSIGAVTAGIAPSAPSHLIGGAGGGSTPRRHPFPGGVGASSGAQSIPTPGQSIPPWGRASPPGAPQVPHPPAAPPPPPPPEGSPRRSVFAYKGPGGSAASGAAVSLLSGWVC